MLDLDTWILGLDPGIVGIRGKITHQEARRPLFTLMEKTQSYQQCLESGSVGSARFWLPGSGSAKICGSTDPDPRAKYQPKTANLNY